MSRVRLTLLAQTLCILLVMAYPNTALPAIFACPSGDTVVYQDRPCPIVHKKKVILQQTHTFPLSIHESWFEVPEQAEERAFCDKRSCECGKLEKRHQGSLSQAVADALYMDGSWHRYESSLAAWLESPISSAQSYDLREQMLDATCHIMMSQVILRNYAEDVVAILKKRVRTAEERGFDIDAPCLQGIPDACGYLASVELFDRLKIDSTALRRKRGENILPASAQVATRSHLP